MSDDVQLIDAALLDRVLARAEASPRRRTNHNFHAGPEDNPHRFLNVMMRDTYVPPHRHVTPPKPEAFLVLRGVATVIVWTEEGRVRERHRLGDGGPLGIDLAAGLWHSVLIESDHAVIYEAKPGPWDPSTDKDFAPWAPREGDPEAVAFMERLRRGDADFSDAE
ncbi:MAG TPA: cupin fold metalloprotein, WbuC family [Myxococcales bacterium]|nr:cupin fold metalloprotein, WbuC family [Myxococcales bacterium]